MTYDDRDPRENPPDLPSEPSPEAPSEPIWDTTPPGDAALPEGGNAPEEATLPEEGERPEEAREAEAEFETATWPAQDTTFREPVPAGEPISPDEPMPPSDEPIPASDEGIGGSEAPIPQDEPIARGESLPAVDEWPVEPDRPPPSDVESYQPSTDVAEPVMPAHSVPATEPGESTRCPRCGTENRPGIAFCRNCGQRLVAAGAPTTVERPAAPEGTQACPRCGTHNRAGVAFCQNCGANLRPTTGGYGAAAPGATPTAAAPAELRRAILGPIVLLIAAIGVAVAWLLPFPFGAGSLYDRAFGAPDGYGAAFWNGYRDIDTLAQQAYFGFAAAAPILVALLVVLAIAGVVRAAPGTLQLIGLVIGLLWAIGLATLFLVVEVVGGPGGAVIDILRALTAGGIIFFLASLIVVIGTLTRFGRG